MYRSSFNRSTVLITRKKPTICEKRACLWTHISKHRLSWVILLSKERKVDTSATVQKWNQNMNTFVISRCSDAVHFFYSHSPKFWPAVYVLFLDFYWQNSLAWTFSLLCKTDFVKNIAKALFLNSSLPVAVDSPLHWDAENNFEMEIRINWDIFSFFWGGKRMLYLYFCGAFMSSFT